MASTAQEETNSDEIISGVDSSDLLLNDRKLNTGNVNEAGHQVGEFPGNVDLPMIHPLPIYPVTTAEDFLAENLRRCSAADDGEQNVDRDVNCDPASDSNIDRDDQDRSVQDHGDRDHVVQDRDDNQNSLEKAFKSEIPLHDESISEIANADVITSAVAPVDTDLCK